jgi:capsule polysaccharide export protein KpsE/RkpR
MYDDLVLMLGLVGIIIYLCSMLIGHTSQSSRVTEAQKKYDREIARLEPRVEEWKAQRGEKNPQMDALIARMLALRLERDQWCRQCEERKEKAQAREAVFPGRISRKLER